MFRSAAAECTDAELMKSTSSMAVFCRSPSRLPALPSGLTCRSRRKWVRRAAFRRDAPVNRAPHLAQQTVEAERLGDDRELPGNRRVVMSSDDERGRVCKPPAPG